MIKVKRTFRGWHILGRRRVVTVKWLFPDIQAFRGSALRQVQFGRLLVRVSRRHKWCPCCQRYHPVEKGGS